MNEVREPKPVCPVCEEPHWPHERHIWLPLSVQQARAAGRLVLDNQAVKRPGASEFSESYARAREIEILGKPGRPRLYDSNAERQRAYRMRLASNDKEGCSHDRS